MSSAASGAFSPLAGPGGLGLKDDAALIDCLPRHRLVATVDAIVAGVHYLPDDPPDLVARKLLRVNLSDLAAMGARPLHYLLATALPATLDDAWVEGFAAGLAEDQKRFGVHLLGGDSAATPVPAVLSLTALGTVASAPRYAAAARSRATGSGSAAQSATPISAVNGCARRRSAASGTSGAN